MSSAKVSRRFSLLACALLLVSLAWAGASARALRVWAAADTARPAPPATATASASAKANAAAGAISPELKATPSGYAFTVATAQPLAAVVRRFWPSTEYMTKAELDTALRSANHLGKTQYVKAGQQLVIPGYEPQPIVERAIPVAPSFEVRAIYLTGTMAGSQMGMDKVRRWRAAGGNAVVFDVKDSDGSVNIPFHHPLAGQRSPAIPNLPKYVRWLHTQGLHVIARIALFRDERLVQQHPELAVQSRRSALASHPNATAAGASGAPQASPPQASSRQASPSQPWRENGKLVWTDPSNPQVQEYDLALAQQTVAGGVDEIQFDYVRFPAEGDQKDAQFAFQKEHPQWARKDVISDFVARAYKLLHPAGVLVSLDVFGVMAWQYEVDVAHTGQEISVLARHCDVLSPMIYPSHFFGMEGYANPGDAPEHFISESMDKFRSVVGDAQAAPSPPAARPGTASDPSTSAVLRPWLQAFAWRTKTYGVDYILTQVRVAKQHGGDGFLFWNARNDYAKPLAAMSEMRAQPGRYFRGDELAKPAATIATK